MKETHQRSPKIQHAQKPKIQHAQNQKYPELIFVSYEETDIKRSKPFKKKKKNQKTENHRELRESQRKRRINDYMIILENHREDGELTYTQ